MIEAQKPAGDLSVEKLLAVAAEDARRRWHLLGLLIRHSFNLCFMVTIATYIFIVLSAFNCFSLRQALRTLCFVTLCYVLMLITSPILKEICIAQYANSAV